MNYEEAAANGYAWSNDQGESKVEEEKRLAQAWRDLEEPVPNVPHGCDTTTTGGCWGSWD